MSSQTSSYPLSGLDPALLEQMLLSARNQGQSPDTLTPDESNVAPTVRQTEMSSQRAKRKKRKHNRDDNEQGDDDSVADKLVAAADEQASRRQREVRWEHFLYGEQKDIRTAVLLEKICGTISPDSKIYDEERRAVLALHRRFQTETLANCLRFCRFMIDGDKDSLGPWAELADPRVDYSDDILVEKVAAAWSWDRFYVVWHWFRHYVDAESSKPLAQYYCQQIWQWNVVETLRYIRTVKKNPREASDAQKTRIMRYVALPCHSNFKNVRRGMFVERSPSVKGSRGTKKQKPNPDSALSHVTMPAPPPADDISDFDV